MRATRGKVTVSHDKNTVTIDDGRGGTAKIDVATARNLRDALSAVLGATVEVHQNIGVVPPGATVVGYRFDNT